MREKEAVIREREDELNVAMQDSNRSKDQLKKLRGELEMSKQDLD